MGSERWEVEGRRYKDVKAGRGIWEVRRELMIESELRRESWEIESDKREVRRSEKQEVNNPISNKGDLNSEIREVWNAMLKVEAWSEKYGVRSGEWRVWSEKWVLRRVGREEWEVRSEQRELRTKKGWVRSDKWDVRNEEWEMKKKWEIRNNK